MYRVQEVLTRGTLDNLKYLYYTYKFQIENANSNPTKFDWSLTKIDNYVDEYNFLAQLVLSQSLQYIIYFLIRSIVL